MQPSIMKCTNAVQMYLAVINEMYSTSQPSLMKCAKLRVYRPRDDIGQQTAAK